MKESEILNKEIEVECVICSDPFPKDGKGPVNKQKMRLGCGHDQYHKHCIEKWL